MAFDEKAYLLERLAGAEDELIKAANDLWGQAEEWSEADRRLTALRQAVDILREEGLITK